MTTHLPRWAVWLSVTFAVALIPACLSRESGPPPGSAPAPAATAPAESEAVGDYTGQRLVEWTGRALGLQYTRRWASYYTADEFSFTFESAAHGRWQVISREPTPFETFRMGTTFTGLPVDWSKNPLVRLVAVRGVDRMPETYPGLTLDPAKTLTVLILEVQAGGHWKPWYVNNWFHRWSTEEENVRVARHYVGQPRYYDLYGWRQDIAVDLTAASKLIGDRFPEWRCYHGVMVKDASARHGIALELRHIFMKNPASGGYECVYGDPKILVPLSAPSPLAASAEKPGWWMTGGGPEHRGVAEPLNPPLELKWEVKGGKAFAGGPAAAGGRVFIGNNDAKLYAVDAEKGQVLWTFPTKTEVESTPTVWGDLVLFGSFDGCVYALEAGTGREKWHFQTGPRLAGFKGIEDVTQGVDSGIAVVDGRAYFGGWDGKVYCLEAETGTPVWNHQTKGMVHWNSPAVADGKVVIGTTDGVLQCLRATDGQPVWSRKLAEPHSDAMMSGPSIAAGMVYAGGGYENGVHALSLTDGALKWQYTAASLVCGSPATDGKRVYGLADGAGHVFAVDAGNGTEIWSRHFGTGWGSCNPVIAGDVLYVTLREGSEDGKPVGLVALDRASGKTLWSFGPGPAWAGPAIADGRLFYGSDDGTLRCFAPRGK